MAEPMGDSLETFSEQGVVEPCPKPMWCIYVAVITRPSPLPPIPPTWHHPHATTRYVMDRSKLLTN